MSEFNCYKITYEWQSGNMHMPETISDRVSEDNVIAQSFNEAQELFLEHPPYELRRIKSMEDLGPVTIYESMKNGYYAVKPEQPQITPMNLEPNT